MPRPVQVCLAALLAATVAGAAACTSDAPAAPASTTAQPTTTTTRPPRGNVDGQLTIGVLLPTSGDAATFTPPLAKAIDLAVGEINKAGGVLGRPVRVVSRDEGSNPATAALALDDLLSHEKVDAVIGPASSKDALAVLDRVVQQRVVMCSPLNTAVALSSYPDDGLYFRTIPPDQLQAVALARAIAATGRRTTGIAYPDDDYGRTYEASLRDELARQDTKVVSAEAYDPSATDLGAVASRLLAAKPDSVAVVGLEDAGGRIVNELRTRGAVPAVTPLFVSDGMRRDDFFQKVDAANPPSVKGIQGTSAAAVPSSASWFLDAFKAAAPGLSPAYASYAYDCANLIALAAEAAHSDDPDVFKQQMVPVSRNGVPCRNYTECVPLLAEGRNIDLDGASGPIEFVADGDPTAGLFDLFEFDDQGHTDMVRQLMVTS